MQKLTAWLFLAAIVAAVAAFAVSTERAEAVDMELDCTAGAVVDGLGTVHCTLTVTDLPDPLDDFSLKLEASYNDLDGSGDPSPGDQLKCIRVTGTTAGNPINVDHCRPDIEPPDLSPPA